MSFNYRAICDRCQYSSEVIWPLWACYRLPSEFTPEIAQRLCWCSHCDAVAVAETLTDIKQIERLQAMPIIANAYDDEKKVWAESEKEAVLEYVRYPRLNHLYDCFTYWKRWNVRQSVIMKNSLALHWEWRQERVSPARCLACGGTEFVPFPANDHGEVQSGWHPGCGGRILLIQGLRVREKRGLWTAEGEKIGFG